MQCEQINDIIMKYFDGHTSELEHEQLQQHIQKCQCCAMDFQALKDALYEIECLPELEAPEHLTLNIMMAVEEQKSFVINKWQMLSWGVGFLGLVLFTYNIISYVILPLLGIAPLTTMPSLMQMMYGMGEALKNGFTGLSFLVGKLVVLRNVLFKEHQVLIVLWMMTFVAAYFMLYRLSSWKEKKDFADIN
jgi:hypothetical protein